MFFTVHEAALAFSTSYDSLRGFMRDELMEELGVKDIWDSNGPWIMDIFPGYVVYQFKNDTWKRPYKVTYGAAGTDPDISFSGTATKVHVAYVDSKESAASVFLGTTESVTVTEAANTQVRESVGFDETAMVKEGKGPSTVPVKLIAAGWGSMAYYSKEVLQRDGPSVFKKGTHMMWNHPTDTEESERPEGDLSNLAAVLMKDAIWDETGPKGAGLYSEAKVFSDYATQVAEKGPHIGISINAAIKCHEGEVEGRTGKIADKFIYAYSTDFVTKAGAGGAPIITATESDRGATTEGDTMTDAEAKALQDKNAVLETQIRTLTESQNRTAAVEAVSSVLREAEIPFKTGLLARACASPVMKEGKPDPEWVKGIVADFSEGHDGKVTGAGDTSKTKEATGKEAQAAKSKATQDRLRESLKELGVPEAGLEIAVTGRG